MQTRNVALDWFKVALSILVICIHTPPLFGNDSILSWYAKEGIARVAVPIFFIINGYFFSSLLEERRSKAIRYFLRILVMYALWTLIYSPLFFTWSTLQYKLYYLIGGYYHLWYLTALLAGSMLLFITYRTTKSITTTLLISFIIYAFAKIFDDFSFDDTSLQLTKGIASRCTRGFFFISLGVYIKQKLKIDNIDRKTLLVSCIGSVALYHVLIYPKLDYPYMYLSKHLILLPLICSILFVTVMRFSFAREVRGYKKYLSSISAGIYFTHIYVLNKSSSYLTEEYNIIHLIPIIIVCIVATIFLIIANKKVKYLL